MTDEDRVLESISIMLGQSFKEVAKRGGVTVKKVRDVVKALDLRGDIDWSPNGEKFRYRNALVWLETSSPLPPLGRGWCCSASSTNRAGFDLVIYDVRAQPEEVKEEIVEDYTDAPTTIPTQLPGMGQTCLF